MVNSQLRYNVAERDTIIVGDPSLAYLEGAASALKTRLDNLESRLFDVAAIVDQLASRVATLENENS